MSELEPLLAQLLRGLLQGCLDIERVGLILAIVEINHEGSDQAPEKGKWEAQLSRELAQLVNERLNIKQVQLILAIVGINHERSDQAQKELVESFNELIRGNNLLDCQKRLLQRYISSRSLS